MKRAEIQLRSAEGAVEQMERQIEPLVLKSMDFKKKKQQKDAATTDLATEVDLFRKTLAQRVIIACSRVQVNYWLYTCRKVRNKLYI